MRIVTLSLLAVAATASATAAFAHHSGAMFDRSKEVVLNGVVKEFQWTNPHSFIQVLVRDANGATAEWSVESASPNNLQRVGWKRTTFKPGDNVAVTVNPIRSGEHAGNFVSAKLANGETITRAGTPQPESR